MNALGTIRLEALCLDFVRERLFLRNFIDPINCFYTANKLVGVRALQFRSGRHALRSVVLDYSILTVMSLKMSQITEVNAHGACLK